MVTSKRVGHERRKGQFVTRRIATIEIFVAFGYNERDKWIRELVVPVIRAFGDEAVSGEVIYGDTLPDGVKEQLRSSQAIIAFQCVSACKRDPQLGVIGVENCPHRGARSRLKTRNFHTVRPDHNRTPMGVVNFGAESQSNGQSGDFEGRPRRSGSQPVLHSQAGHLGKLADVVGNEREIAGQRVGGNQVVVCTDRSASALECRPYLDVLRIDPLVQRQDLDGRRKFGF